MSGLLVLVLVVIVLGAVGNGFREVGGMLTAFVRSFSGSRTRRGRSGERAGTLVPAVICIVLGAFGALGTVLSRSEGAAVFSAIMLGIGIPLLIITVYRGLGIAQPPLYALVLAAGIIISPFGLLAWYAAVIAAEIMAAGLLLLWYDRKDKILDTLGQGQDGAGAAQSQYQRLRRTTIVLIVLACTVTLTAFSAAYVWLWLIVVAAVAAVFMVRKLKAMRQAKEEEARAREAEVDRILNTKIAGLDDEDDELLRRYLQKNNVPLRKGERLALTDDRVEVRLTGAAPGGDLDCYVFLLDKQNKVQGDQDLVFFGQPSSPDGSVTVVDGASGPGVDIQLERVAGRLAEVVVAFALGVDAPPGTTWTGGTLIEESGTET